MQSKIFETMSVARLFFYCVLPGTVSMAASALYIVIDGMFVGHYMGAQSMAAINLMWPLLGISFALADMVATGASVQMSMFLGNHDKHKASVTFSFCVKLMVLLSIFAGIFGYLLTPTFLRIIGADAQTTALGTEYVRQYCIFAPLVTLFFSVDNYLRICGKQKFSMWLNVAVSLLNLILDYIFIVQLRQGVWSASFTTCLALSFGTIIGMWPFIKGKLDVTFVKGVVPLKQFLRLITNGSTTLLNTVANSVLLLCINSVLLHLGGSVAVAATSAVMYIDSVVAMLLFGMPSALQPALSYCYGAKRIDRVIVIEKWVLGASAVVAILAFVLMQTCGSYLIPLYAKEGDIVFINLGMRCMTLFAFSYLTIWIETCLVELLQALESPIRSFIVSIGRMFVFPLLGLWFLSPWLGLDGVWLTAPFASVLSAILSIIVTVSLWKEKKLLLPTI